MGKPFKINAKVASKLHEAKSSIDNAREVAEASRSIAEGITLVNHRQKLIKMADASDSG